jgi:hypothetical protein
MGTLVLGKIYKYYLTNNYSFEGELLAEDEKFLKIKDDRSDTEQTIPITAILNIEARE